MKKALILLAACGLMAACGKKPDTKEQLVAISTYESLPGDSTRYGLACDGSTDSILIVLPYAGGNPDTFNIIRAFEEHRLYGRPQVGDELAVIMTPDSTDEVLTVINVSKLQGDWYYRVEPTLRMHNAQARPIPDSTLKRIMAPREYSIRLRRGGAAHSMGARQQNTDAMSPVKYPDMKRYTAWQLYNGQLILLPDSSSQQQPDTATILLLRRDSLVLRFSDHEQGYYRKR